MLTTSTVLGNIWFDLLCLFLMMISLHLDLSLRSDNFLVYNITKSSFIWDTKMVGPDITLPIASFNLFFIFLKPTGDIGGWIVVNVF